MTFLDQRSVDRIGFRSVGNGVRISDAARFYGAERISIGDNSRIDDFCVISAGAGGVHIGRYVHIACFCTVIGRERVVLEDFSGLSGRVSIYSSSDDYSGEWLTNPTVPSQYRQTRDGEVRIGRHVIIGAGAVVLPGVDIAEGAAVGALTLVTRSLPAMSVYSGIPARRIRGRSDRMLELERALLQEHVKKS